MLFPFYSAPQKHAIRHKKCQNLTKKSVSTKIFSSPGPGKKLVLVLYNPQSTQISDGIKLLKEQMNELLSKQIADKEISLLSSI